MSFRVINNPDYLKSNNQTGFKNHEFKKLSGLFSRGASAKVIYDIGVDVNFEESICNFVYYRSSTYIPYVHFIIRQVGPRTTMYEVWKEGKGRIAKSGLFARAFERLEKEVEELINLD